ncbi:DUF4142 domain-containing protein [Methylobacillus gramineus]|uniref:DUF4142 domain-containing protein n=1 Tax=Methylobacillus gramineus TaxID=755169 RepID=UPI001CFF77A6|nr:DUF4142 domain-containing protein [Methylobacillus gramineus]MCB5184998.1 DUF4142 domain-containing protein [Methylobacillus gramineus]
MPQSTSGKYLNFLALLLVVTPMLLSDLLAAEKLSSKDNSYLKDMAGLNLLQVEASELAAVKSSNDKVKAFARQLIKERHELTQQLKAFADKKQTNLPDEPSLIQKARYRVLSAKDGAEFDQAYAKTMGVKVQQDTVHLFSKAASRAEDPDLKRFALQHLPALENHLQQARELRDHFAATK